MNDEARKAAESWRQSQLDKRATDWKYRPEGVVEAFEAGVEWALRRYRHLGPISIPEDAAQLMIFNSLRSQATPPAPPCEEGSLGDKEE